ncbi:hypothetical protein GCM10009116_25980 [Brevundimonas basaltis]
MALTTTAVVASMVAGSGNDASDVVLSVLTSLYPDELIPRLLLAALLAFGGFSFLRSETRRYVRVIAAACAITGLLAGALLVVRVEIAFAEVFPDGGADLGWAPGQARAKFLPPSYLTASTQVALSFMASMTLLAIDQLKRRAPARGGPS